MTVAPAPTIDVTSSVPPTIARRSASRRAPSAVTPSDQVVTPLSVTTTWGEPKLSRTTTSSGSPHRGAARSYLLDHAHRSSRSVWLSAGRRGRRDGAHRQRRRAACRSSSATASRLRIAGPCRSRSRRVSSRLISRVTLRDLEFRERLAQEETSASVTSRLEVQAPRRAGVRWHHALLERAVQPWRPRGTRISSCARAWARSACGSLVARQAGLGAGGSVSGRRPFEAAAAAQPGSSVVHDRPGRGAAEPSGSTRVTDAAPPAATAPAALAAVDRVRESPQQHRVRRDQ